MWISGTGAALPGEPPSQAPGLAARCAVRNGIGGSRASP